MRVYLARELLQANQKGAEENRMLLHQNAVLMVNVIGSPGSGKTCRLREETFTPQIISQWRWTSWLP